MIGRDVGYAYVKFAVHVRQNVDRRTWICVILRAYLTYSVTERLTAAIINSNPCQSLSLPPFSPLTHRHQHLTKAHVMRDQNAGTWFISSFGSLAGKSAHV